MPNNCADADDGPGANNDGWVCEVEGPGAAAAAPRRSSSNFCAACSSSSFKTIMMEEEGKEGMAKLVSPSYLALIHK